MLGSGCHVLTIGGMYESLELTFPSPASSRMFLCGELPLLFFFFDLIPPFLLVSILSSSSRKPSLANASSFPANLSTTLCRGWPPSPEL